MEENYIEELRKTVTFDKYVKFLSQHSSYKNMQVFYPGYCWALLNLYCVSNLNKSHINETSLHIYRDELKLFYLSLKTKPALFKNRTKSKEIMPRIDNEKVSDNLFNKGNISDNEKLHKEFHQLLRERPLPAGQELKSVKIELSVVDFLLKENLLSVDKLNKREIDYCDYAK